MKTKLKMPALLVVLLVFLSACEKIEFDARSKFTGRYAVEEFSKTDGSLSYYNIRIRMVSATQDEMVFENFFNAGINVYGIVVGHRVYIEAQTAGRYWVEGQGTLSGNVLSMSYFVEAAIGQSVFGHDLAATLTRY